ncbi:hypothetical protein [Nocardia crassostreae]|uniref:hypothetical protein n=1 Tax=Nocardia crassostreae TaxID=53428 RepID=UPI00083482A1|nr:hypothetical protein [Nocardia crassostreae]
MTFTLSQLIEMAAHEGPDTPLTTEEAHEIMRLHRECAAYYCPRKTAAFEVLIESGRIVPDAARRH